MNDHIWSFIHSYTLNICIYAEYYCCYSYVHIFTADQLVLDNLPSNLSLENSGSSLCSHLIACGSLSGETIGDNHCYYYLGLVYQVILLQFHKHSFLACTEYTLSQYPRRYHNPWGLKIFMSPIPWYSLFFKNMNFIQKYPFRLWTPKSVVLCILDKFEFPWCSPMSQKQVS